MPGLHAHALLVSLATGLSLNALALPPRRSLGQEIYRGDSANTATEGIMVGLYWSASAWIGLEIGSDRFSLLEINQNPINPELFHWSPWVFHKLEFSPSFKKNWFLVL
jgi:hypothetical protein